MTEPSKTLISIAGEYFVAAELFRRNFLASITLRNNNRIAIHIPTFNKERILSIQVKTKQQKIDYWLMSKKVE